MFFKFRQPTNMNKAQRGPTWFEDEQFLESTVRFPGAPPSQWRLESKIYEHEYSLAGRDGDSKVSGESDRKSDHTGEGGERRRSSYEACAIYTCTRLDEAKPATTDDSDEAETQAGDKTGARRKPGPEPDPPPEKAIMKIRLQYPSVSHDRSR